MDVTLADVKTVKDIALGLLDMVRKFSVLRGGQDNGQATCDLTMHLVGATLYEIKANIEHANAVVEGSSVPLDFTVSSALMPELCKVAPSPFFLEQLRSMLAKLKAIDFFLRTSAGASSEEPETDYHFAAGVFSDRAKLFKQGQNVANRAFEDEALIPKFDWLHSVAVEMVTEVYRGREATQTTANILPGPFVAP